MLWQKFELVRDFIPVMDTCKFEKLAINWKRSNMGFCSTQGKVTKTNSTIWPYFELVQDFMPDLDTCKFKEVAIKTEGVMPQKHFSTQWQVTLR